MIVVASVVLVSFVPTSGSTDRNKGKNLRLVVTETSISKGSVPGLHSRKMGAISADYAKVAYVIFKNGRCWVVVNGVKGKEYAGIGKDMAFTHNGRLFYPAERSRKSQKQLCVIDGVESKMFGAISWKSTRFSPDGKHIIYAICPDQDYQWGVVYDGAIQKIYDDIYTPVFSPDSKRWAYIARAGSTFFQVIDGVEQKKYDQMSVSGIVFSPNSKRTAYMAFQGKQKIIVVDGAEGKKYSRTSDPVFSPDSKHVAYSARDGNKWMCVLDGKEQKPCYDGMSKPVFTSGNKVAFVASNHEEGSRIVIGGVEGKGRYDSYVKHPIKDSAIINSGRNRTAFLSERKKQFYWVVDDKPGKLYDKIPNPRITFSPDGKHFAYAAVRGMIWAMVVDGKEQVVGKSVSKPVFSPDSKHLAYHVSQPDGGSVVRDGILGKKYNAAYPHTITFSPDSKHLLYVARRKGEGKHRIVVDGVETEEAYDGIYRTAGFLFKGNNTFRTVAVRNEELFWVDVRIVGGATTVPKIRQKTKPATKPIAKPKNDPKDKANRECKIWLNMATIYINHGKPEKAKIYLKRIISMYPKTDWSKKAQKILSEIEKPGK